MATLLSANIHDAFARLVVREVKNRIPKMRDKALVEQALEVAMRVGAGREDNDPGQEFFTADAELPVLKAEILKRLRKARK